MSQVEQYRKIQQKTSIRIEVKSIKGKCAAMNAPGDVFLIEKPFSLPVCQSGSKQLCAMAYHSLYPTIFALQMTGRITFTYQGSDFENRDTAVDYVACPDPVNAVVYEVRRIVAEE